MSPCPASTYFAAVRHLTQRAAAKTTGPNLARKTSGTRHPGHQLRPAPVGTGTASSSSSDQTAAPTLPTAPRETWDFYKSTFARNGITEQRYGGVLAASTTATRT
ncbi:hypothetical protein [Streptomyces sp. KL116D]|uniref:hypothetical protein n=1 Tax=Streptomyces sp. KL116D TaxID=3045152 RepID=UPI003556E60C